MRTWGRVYTNVERTAWEWRMVETAADGSNDLVYLVTLIQCLKLNLAESPFYADHGIPAKGAVMQQIFPDYYVTQTQAQFAPHFASLIISKTAPDDPRFPSPVYRIEATTHQGVQIREVVPT